MRLNFIIMFLGIFSANTLKAQEANLVAGGDASGSTGSVSWSAGQIDYLNNQGVDGATTQGVQQPFELFLLSADGYLAEPLEIKIFPNPTSTNALIRFKETPAEEFVFVLSDMRGSILQSGRIDGQEIELNLSQLPPAVYKIQLNGPEGSSQVFKLVKY